MTAYGPYVMRDGSQVVPVPRIIQTGFIVANRLFREVQFLPPAGRESGVDASSGSEVC